MIKATIKAMENSVTKELELFNKLNDDEAFNYLRLNRDGRRKELIDHLKVPITFFSLGSLRTFSGLGIRCIN